MLSADGESMAPLRGTNTKPRAATWGVTSVTSACIAAGAVLVGVH